MCLNIDGEVYCSVLLQASYEGRSLERIEHDLEEGKYPYTPEIEARLAEVCGLSIEIYRDRLLRLRSQNVLRQLRYASDVCDDFGPYFHFPPSCVEYIQGVVHELEQVDGIIDETQQELKRRLRQERFKYFCRRIDRGVFETELAEYPERDEWLPLAAQELITRNRRLTVYTRSLFEQNIIPPAGMFCFPEQREKLLAKFALWFSDRSWDTAPPAVRQFLTEEELATLEDLAATRRRIKLEKPRKKRGQCQPRGLRDDWRRRMRIEAERVLAYKQELKRRYLPLIEQACLYGIFPETDYKKAA